MIAAAPTETVPTAAGADCPATRSPAADMGLGAPGRPVVKQDGSERSDEDC
jgi:hypothetical protein